MKTINHECYVSIEVAKLLKEAGFDWKCKYAYIITPDGDMPTGEEGMLTEYVENVNWLVSAPTLDVAQRWLREAKGFMVETTFITDEYSVIYQANLYEVVSENSSEGFSELISVVKGQSELKRTYEEAQEAGIKKALELILEKGE